jgi:LysM domain
VRRKRPGTSSSAARFAAPVVFLAAVTVAVLLVRSGLSEGDDRASRAGTLATTTARSPSTAEEPVITLPGATLPGATVAGEGKVYEIEAGDTLETIAAEFDTTVERLLTLNPDLDPVALRIGQEIRVE